MPLRRALEHENEPGRPFFGGMTMISENNVGCLPVYAEWVRRSGRRLQAMSSASCIDSAGSKVEIVMRIAGELLMR